MVVPGPGPALVGVAPARVRHAGRLRPRPVRVTHARAARRDHRHRGHDAVHRAAAGRHRGRPQDHGHHRHHWPHLPIIIAFAILAAYTYQSGLRAPALIAFVKDSLIYLVIIVAVIYIPAKLGGWSHIFGAADRQVRQDAGAGDGILLNPANQWQYITLALGSALALFLYPHSVTGVLASKNRDVIKRNMSALPAYSLPARPDRAARVHGDRGEDQAAAAKRQGRQQHDRAACCSTSCSRAGSPASRSPRSASARWCPRPSCRSRRRTCSPATSTRSTSSATPRPRRRRRSARSPRWW